MSIGLDELRLEVQRLRERQARVERAIVTVIEEHRVAIAALTAQVAEQGERIDAIAFELGHRRRA
jgi:hypothetical protein